MTQESKGESTAAEILDGRDLFEQFSKAIRREVVERSQLNLNQVRDIYNVRDVVEALDVPVKDITGTNVSYDHVYSPDLSETTNVVWLL